jgi:hypothetical protein
LLPLLAALSACGDGTWGAEITFTLVTTDASELTLSPGSTVDLPGTGRRVVVQRACLSVETVVISPAQTDGGDGGDGGDETCFCHGDPPHCHGDCEPAEAGAAPPLVRSVHRVVDLLAGPSPVVTGGVAPGEYDTVTLSFGEAPADSVDLPAACAQMAGRTFWIEGTLEDPATDGAWPLTIDLRVSDKVTEPLVSASAVKATEQGGQLSLQLRLSRVLTAVDWSRVSPDPQGQVVVGGATSQHIVAVGELVAGLRAADSYHGAAP